MPDEEEREEGDSGRFSEGENEELINCGLKLRKVSFIEKVDRKSSGGGCVPTIEDSFLEDGSPTMVEKGMDPASVFETYDDADDNEMKDTGGSANESVAAAPLPSGPESTVRVRHHRRQRSLERLDSETKRESWIDPPEEQESTILAQAEIESCMQTYEVGQHTHINRYS